MIQACGSPQGYQFGLNDSKQKETPLKVLAHSQKQPTEEVNIEEALHRAAQTRHHGEKARLCNALGSTSVFLFWDEAPGSSNSEKGCFWLAV